MTKIAIAMRQPGCGFDLAIWGMMISFHVSVPFDFRARKAQTPVGPHDPNDVSALKAGVYAGACSW